MLINQGSLFDHYISAPQLFEGVEAIVLGNKPPALRAAWSLKHLGWGLLFLMLGLSVFQVRNVLSLRGWGEKTRMWPARKRNFDIALNFLIPTVILVVVFSAVKSYFGYRFNLTYQLINMSSLVGDIVFLMIVGSVPDYLQGCVKLFWLFTGKLNR